MNNKMVNGTLAGLVLASGVAIPQQQVEAAQAQHTLDHVDIRIHNANFTLNSITYNPDGSIANQESETKQADVIGAHSVIINYTKGGSVELNNFTFTNEDGGEIRAMFNNNGLGKLKFGDIASVTFVVDLQAKDGTIYRNVNVTLSGQYMHDAYSRCPGWDYNNKGLDFLIPASDNVSVTLEAYNVTVNYIDEATGQQIAQSYVDNVVEGHSYDVSNKDDEIVIDGYEYVRTEGNVTGSNMSGNEVVNVYYRQLENYSVTINYLDAATEEPIAESYLSELIREGGSYDVSHLDDEIVIDKYDYVRTEGELSGVMDENKVINVFYKRKSVPMTPLIPAEPIPYDITVKYVDEEGNELQDPFIQEDVDAGSEFDVTEQTELEIPGYVIEEIQGETSGKVDEDEVIIVVYRPQREFEVFVNYLDKETGEQIGDPYKEMVLEGEGFDVSHLDNEVEFEKYNYVETEGDVIVESVHEDTIINVYYERKSVPMTPLFPALPMEYDITIRYVDEEGNELQDPFILEEVDAGTEYDVTDRDDEVVIPGYEYVETQGEPSGVVDGDKVITVVYREVPEVLHDLVVRYVDIDGNELLPSIVEHDKFKDGEQVELDYVEDIEGYQYLTGGNVIGQVHEDVEITVVYRPLEEYTVTINYLDVDTNEPLIDFYQERVTEGESYYVYDKDNEIDIPGYQYVRTEGNVVGHNMDEDVVINVYFETVDIFTVTVNYLDEEGNVLRDPYSAEVTEGTNYNVSGLDDEIEINGYEYKETLGDELISDSIDGDKVINVIYTKVEEPEQEPDQPIVPEVKVFDLIIEYVDAATGKPIGAPYFEGIVEGGSYDVSHLDDEVEFEGYEFKSVSGDVIGEGVDGNVRIVVLYDKVVEEEPTVPSIPMIPLLPSFPTPQPELPELEPKPEPTPQPEQPQEQQKPQQPEQPKAEVEFDVPQTGLDTSIYMGIATALASAGFAVRIKKERK